MFVIPYTLPLIVTLQPIAVISSEIPNTLTILLVNLNKNNLKIVYYFLRQFNVNLNIFRSR